VSRSSPLPGRLSAYLLTGLAVILLAVITVYGANLLVRAVIKFTTPEPHCVYVGEFRSDPDTMRLLGCVGPER
jgi:hypothetical protein